MRIERIHIDSFGPLQAFDLQPKAGVNIIEGRNEAGKSTICSFLRYMLYGMNKAERECCLSWKTGTVGGYLELSDTDGKWRIERSITSSGKESLKMIDLITNTQCHRGKIPGEVLLGLPQDLYVRTAYVSQSDGAAIAGGDLSEAIGNLLFSADESVNTQKALKKLDEARIPLLYKNRRGGEIYALEKECDLLQERLDKASEENAAVISKEGSLAATIQTIAEDQKKYDRLDRQISYGKIMNQLVQFDRFHQAESLRDTAANNLKKLESSQRSQNYLPDEDYVVQLRRAAEQSVMAKHDFEEAERLCEEIRRRENHLEEREAFLEKLALEGGKDAVIARYQTIVRQAKKTRLAAFLTLLLIPLSIWLFIRAAQLQKEATRVLTGYRCSSEEQLRTLFHRAEEDQKRIEQYYKDLHAQENRCRLLEQTCHKDEQLLTELAAKWGKSSAEEAIAAAEALFTERQTLQRELEKATAVVDGLALSLRGYEEQSMRQHLAELQAAGVTPLEEAESEAAKRTYDYLGKALESLQARKHQLEMELATLRATVENPAAIQDQLSAKSKRLQNLQRRYRAYLLAYQKIEEAAGNLRQSVSPRLSKYAGEVLHSVTAGKYATLGVGRDMTMEYTANGEGGSLSTHSVDVLSAGTRDAAYVALRLALLRLLCRKTMPPIIFDESFSRLDDERLRAMLQMITSFAGEENQVLLFTSSGRDGTFAAGLHPVTCMQMYAET